MATGWEQYEAIYIKFMNFQDGPHELLRDVSVVVRYQDMQGSISNALKDGAPLILSCPVFVLSRTQAKGSSLTCLYADVSPCRARTLGKQC